MSERSLRTGSSKVAASSWSRDPPGSGVESVLPAALLFVGLAATGGAVYVISVSKIVPHPLGRSLVTAVVCLSFVGAGAIAVRLRPYARFGLLLAAVGFASLISVLHEANIAAAYGVGLLASNLVFALLVHALVAFPSGRLRTAARTVLVTAAYVNVVVLQTVAVLVDPLTRYHSDHPRNLLLIDPHATLATVLLELEAAIALAIALAAILVLSGRARAATPAARRQLVPVLIGGTVALLFMAVGLALAPLSSRAGVVGFGLGLLAALALPAAFLGVVLQGRLSRAAVGELLVELREPGEAPLLRDGLRRALGDPSLELLRVRPEDGAHLDSFGETVAPPTAGHAQVATPILHQGEPVGALVHDRTLRLRPELLDAVSAAAGFALANERALATARRVEARNIALLDAIPDLMFRIARDGTYLDVRADNPTGLVAPPHELIGSNVRVHLPDDVTRAVMACIERALSSGAMSSVEYELEIEGVSRCFESRMVPSGDGEVVTIVRDFTEQRRTEVEQRRLAEEQAALRRVATLVAGEAPPDEVFQVVTEEVCRLLGLRSALLIRYGSNESAMIVGKFGAPSNDFELGSSFTLEEGAARTVLRTGAAARIDYDDLAGGLAGRMLAHGFRSSVGVPISVAGSIWGALIAALRADEALPHGTGRRLKAFAELIAIAVASAQARDELAASRLRIVEASDAERRRLERNLHDGAQQRLVALSVDLRLVQDKIRRAPHEAEELVAVASEELSAALVELRELAQGLHPAILTERGLAEALEVLAARAPLPVELDVRLAGRLPEPVEAAAYYVVSEALVNVVKHARAESAVVRVLQTNGSAHVEVVDDGDGGADLDGGSGLCGLRDRVETLEGSLDIESAAGHGTRVIAELPLERHPLDGVGTS